MLMTRKHSTLHSHSILMIDDSCSHLTLSNRHFLMDEGPSTSTPPLPRQKLLVVPGNPSFHHIFTIQLGTSTITPSKQPETLELWLMISWLSQTTLLKLPGPADLLYSTSRRSGPFFRNMIHNCLFKLLFCPGWTIAVLSWQVFQPVLSNLYN